MLYIAGDPTIAKFQQELRKELEAAKNKNTDKTTSTPTKESSISPAKDKSQLKDKKISSSTKKSGIK